MIREDRDVAFWSAVAEHPAVAPHVSLGRDFDISTLIQHPLVTPLRSDHGGFLFVRIDQLGRIYDLHALFTPDAWGREVNSAFKGALSEMFRRGADIVTSLEVLDWWRSRPPRSFGFRPAGEPFRAEGFDLRSWSLTRSAWNASPARKRLV